MKSLYFPDAITTTLITLSTYFKVNATPFVQQANTH